MSTKSKHRLGRRYDRAARFYELSAEIYSTGQIRASKRFQKSFIRPGDRVLFVGAGAGEDAMMAARLGADVTCVDISEKMLDQLQRKMEQAGVELELICSDAMMFDRFEQYDVVAANYFLNVFRRTQMQEMLTHTAKLVRPGGLYLIADVSLPQGNFLSKAFNLFYLKAAMGGACLLGLVPWHENYDYPAFFNDADLELSEVKHFRFAKVGPILFQSIVGRKKTADKLAA